MELLLYKSLFAYFAFGAVITQIVNRNQLMTIRRKNWLKYFTYLLLVNIVFASILMQPSLFPYVADIIIFFGGLELIKHLRHHKNKAQSAIIGLLFIFFAYHFFQFSHLPIPIIFYTYFLVTIFDGFSQLFGQLLGKTKFVPSISPNKTIEGLLGGIFVTILTSILIRSALQLSVYQAFKVGLGIATFSFLGDLLASYGKRKIGIKDYSKWIPGHGGFLDRFDSLMLAAFFALMLSRYVGI